MAKVSRFRFSPARSVEAINRAVREVQTQGVIMRRAGRYDGGRVELDGRMLANFGSCSYLGLDQRRELRDGAIAATTEYGTQFSFSRAYLESPLYAQLEALLEAMTGASVLVAPSTTLAHMAALPVLLHDHDAVIIDQFAHASLHAATEMLGEIPVHTVRHNRMDLLETLIGELSPRHERIWILIDGLYSMLGEWAPFDGLNQILRRYPQVHCYIDDAHGTGWTGSHGRGGALSHIEDRSRVVVALSLNKSFACAGGALVVFDDDLKMRLRRAGGPMLFSGPIQPPMLGAAVASAQLHLAPAHAALQRELLDRIDYVLAAATSYGVTLASRDRTPVFFLACDSSRQVCARVRELWACGFYVSPSAFPAVPVNAPGVRFTVSLHNSEQDIDGLMSAIAAVWSNGRAYAAADRAAAEVSDG